MIKSKRYYYVPCQAIGKTVNPEFSHYFRLYTDVKGVPTLVEQGLADIADSWKEKYGAEFEPTNPYPKLD